MSKLDLNDYRKAFRTSKMVTNRLKMTKLKMHKNQKAKKGTGYLHSGQLVAGNFLGIIKMCPGVFSAWC